MKHRQAVIFRRKEKKADCCGIDFTAGVCTRKTGTLKNQRAGKKRGLTGSHFQLTVVIEPAAAGRGQLRPIGQSDGQHQIQLVLSIEFPTLRHTREFLPRFRPLDTEQLSLRLAGKHQPAGLCKGDRLQSLHQRTERR